MADRTSRERLVKALAEADRIEREIIDLDHQKDIMEINRLAEELQPTVEH